MVDGIKNKKQKTKSISVHFYASSVQQDQNIMEDQTESACLYPFAEISTFGSTTVVRRKLLITRGFDQ